MSRIAESPRPTAPLAPSAPALSTSHPPPATSFATVLESLAKTATSGERTMTAATSGKDYGPAELLALQAGVYRYSEAIDLASKLVDRATNGVKTVITGQ